MVAPSVTWPTGKRPAFSSSASVMSEVVSPAAVSAAGGYRTLLVDLDAQANSSHYLSGLAGDDLPTGIADYFKQVLAGGAAGKIVLDL